MERTTDWNRFGALMELLGEVFGPASTLKIQAYWMALYQYEWTDVEFAAMRCLETRRSSGGYPGSWPTPADFTALMWNDLDAIPDATGLSGRRALPEPRADPEIVRANLDAVRTLLSHTSERLPKLSAPRTDSEDPYRGGGPTWVLTERHWRARWDLYRKDPGYKPLADAIPERLRLKFSAEDEAERHGKTTGKEEVPY
mgnify:FL=1